jgi:hypothetical protein
MKRFYFLPLLLLLLAACSGGVETTPTAPADNGSPTLAPASTNETTEPTATPEGYPGVSIPEFQPTSPYPADGEYWLVRPAGLQCEDPAYPDLETAVRALEDAGVTILDSEEMTLAVCEACGCPTALHFRIQVSGSDLSQAMTLGWVIEQ